MELSKLQKEILNKQDKKIVVMASAAAGKTMVLTEKVRRILQSGVDPRDVAVITFTNMAADVLRKRLGEDYRDGIFIGTIHSLANRFLLSYGVDTSNAINNEDFDQLFELVSDHPNCVKTIKYLLLDEAQDTGDLEFEFIFDMINPENFFVVGDMKQAIYQFKGANEKLFYNLSKRSDVATYQLNHNYRNGYNILSFAKRLIQPTGLKDISVSLYPTQGFVKEIYFNKNKILELLKNEEYKDWAILTRSNADADDMIYLLKKNNIPCEGFKQSKLNKDELSQKMEENTVKVLTIHSAKGLEWKKVIAMGMKYFSNAERNVNYVAATRAKEELYWIIEEPKYKKKVMSFNWE
jgi:superfamily I DNA/RNA helicase